MTSKSKPRPIVLRVELQEVTPIVWRRIVVSDEWTLSSLHQYLQWIVGWTDSHPHEFQVGAGIVAPKWWISEVGDDGSEVAAYRDERRVSVASVVAELGVGGVVEYRYDMGDDWQHDVIIESRDATKRYGHLPLPTCVGGQNACPPEDVGGPHGYHHFLAIMKDRRNEHYADTARWIGGVFDPKGFDLNHLNREWKGVRARERR